MMTGATSALNGEDGKEEEGKQSPVMDEAANQSENNNRTKSSTAKTIKRVVSSILPHVKPLQWTTFVCLSLWCSIPAVIYILLFTVRNFTYRDLSRIQQQLFQYKSHSSFFISSIEANRSWRIILLPTVSNIWRICIFIGWELSNSCLLLLYIGHW